MTLLCFTQTFEATSWEMSINFSVDFESDRAANAKTKFQIYYLAQLPSLGDLKTFAHEIYDDTVQGFVIRTEPIKSRRAHSSNWKIRLESHGKFGKIKKSKEGENYCKMAFTDAIYRIESDNDRNITMLEVKRDENSNWDLCFVYPYAIDYMVHTFIAASGDERSRRQVDIKSIMFYDNEVSIEGEEEQI